MTTAATLGCDHCGGEAIESATGLFGDGDGTACMSCGMPGTVSIDDADEEDVTAYWDVSSADGAVCNDQDCIECAEFRAFGQDGGKNDAT